jgi:hypothetical protein
MRRQAVTVRQLRWPFIVPILGSLLVLIVWQIIDPREWQRTIVNDDPLETIGECVNPKYGLVPFVTPIAILVLYAVLRTAYIAWKMRNIQSDLSEAWYIFFGLYSHVQISMVGIPIIVITSQVSVLASFIMLVIMTVVLSITMVGRLQTSPD